MFWAQKCCSALFWVCLCMHRQGTAQVEKKEHREREESFNPAWTALVCCPGKRQGRRCQSEGDGWRSFNREIVSGCLIHLVIKKAGISMFLLTYNSALKVPDPYSPRNWKYWQDPKYSLASQVQREATSVASGTCFPSREMLSWCSCHTKNDQIMVLFAEIKTRQKDLM